jgi:hypothetical protein
MHFSIPCLVIASAATALLYGLSEAQAKTCPTMLTRASALPC